MKGYLLDTDIVIFLFRNQKGIAKRLASVAPEDVYVSEVTVAELEYGNYCGGRYTENKEILNRFLSCVNVIPFSEAIVTTQSFYKMQIALTMGIAHRDC